MIKKYLLMFMIIVAVLLIGGGFWLSHYLNSDKVRAQIVTLAKTHLDRDVALNGPINWSVYPSIGIKLEKVVIGNPSTIKSDDAFVSADEAHVAVALLPLVTHEIVVESVVLKNANIHLIQQGAATNWQFGQADSAPEAGAKKEVNNSDASNWQLAVSDVSIEETTLYWQQDKHVPLEFHIKQLKTSRVAFNKSFDIEFDGDLKGGDPAIDLQAQLKATAIIDSEQQIYTFKPLTVAIQAQQLPGLSQPMKLNGQLSLETKPDTISVNDLMVTVDKSQFKGQFTVQPKAAKANFDLQISSLDLGPYLSSSSHKSSASSVRDKAASSKAVDTANNLLTLAIDGKIAVDELIVPPLKIAALKAHLQAANSNWQLSDVTAELYNGVYQGSVQVNFQSGTPHVTLVSSFQGLAIDALLKALQQKVVVSGAADMQLNVTSSGQDQVSLLQQLNGSSSFKMQNGVYHGVDVNYWWQTGKAILDRQLPASHNSGQTKFENLSASFVIKQGIAQSEDTVLQTASVAAHGVGDINLPRQTIDYVVKLTEVAHSENTIPLKVAGPITSPNVSISEQFMRDLGIKQLENVVKKQLPGGLRSNNTDESGSNNASDLVKNKLKGLFGQ